MADVGRYRFSLKCDISGKSATKAEHPMTAKPSTTRKSLKRNALWNLTGSIAPLLAGIALIPYTLAQLGGEAFGVLTLIWGLIGYFSLFDFGVGRALTFQLSRLAANGQEADIGSVLRAGLLVTLGTGLLGVLLIGALASHLATQWLKISPLLQSDAHQAFLIAALGILPTTLASGMRGAMEGLDQFAASNLGRIVLGFWMFALPAWSVYAHGPNLALIAWYLVLGRCMVLTLMALHMRQHLFDSSAALDKKHFQGLWNYGFWVTVTSIVGPLMVYGDRFFVSAAVGAEQLPLYAIPQEALLRLLLIPMALTGALLPRLAAMDDVQTVQAYKQTYRLVAFVMLAVSVAAALAAYPVLSVWITKDFAHDAMPVVLILCVGVWINSLASVPFILLQAKGNPRVTALFHLAELVLYLTLIWVLAAHYGLIGAAMAWLARVILDWVLLHCAVRRLYGV